MRPITLQDANEKYLSLLNDHKTSRYVESRFEKHSPESLRKFVAEQVVKRPATFFAIILKENEEHIGNIKIGKIHSVHKYADVGILIGEKAYWGKGYAAEAIELIVRYAFDNLGLNKLIAGAYSPNVGSVKAFEKAGFAIEGVRKKIFWDSNQYVDEILLGINNPKTIFA